MTSFSFNNKFLNSNIFFNNSKKQINDTIFYVKELKHELAGASYRKGGKIYQSILRNDTTNFLIYISESKNGKLALEYRKNNYKCSHKTSLSLLRKVLPLIQIDYSLDSLKSIYLGRLISHGDLAINVSKQYIKEISKTYKIIKYESIFSFFMKSQIVKDFNDLLKPYNLKISKISAEKIFFTSKSECLRYSDVETKENEIPEKILDGIIYLKITKL